MAVFTTLTDTEATELLSRWSLGRLISLTPILAGIENTNYFVETDSGSWVLTILEKITDRTLPFYLSYMEHLAAKGCTVASPRRTVAGDLFDHWAGKPVIVCNRLEGEDGKRVGPRACAQMGALLAKMHLAVADFRLWQDNPRGLAWWIETIPQILPLIPEELRGDLAGELQEQIALQGSPAWKALPAGACHSDLFRNNTKVLRQGTPEEEVTGVFDFFFSGCVPFLYDLAVTMNDWCTDISTGRFDMERARAFITAYSRVRSLSGEETALWRGALRAAAFRFWVSRLSDFYRPRDAALLTPHNPEEFHRILLDRRGCELPLPEAL